MAGTNIQIPDGIVISRKAPSLGDVSGSYLGPVRKDGILKSFRKSSEKHHNI
jgi:hypothetical protein